MGNKVLVVQDPNLYYLGGSERGCQIKREERWEAGAYGVAEVNQQTA